MDGWVGGWVRLSTLRSGGRGVVVRCSAEIERGAERRGYEGWRFDCLGVEIEDGEVG